MKEDCKRETEEDEVDDRTGDESIAKEAEAISKEMKAREEVINYYTIIQQYLRTY